MASVKERARWERWFDQVTDRMARQRKSIERLVLVNTEALAALHEIAQMGEGHLTTAQLPLTPAIERAQAALDRIEGPSAAITDEARELANSGDPDDPRNGKGK